MWRQRRRFRVTTTKQASPSASNPHTQAPTMGSEELPPELSACRVATGCGEAGATTTGLDVGVIDGITLPAFSPGTAAVELAAAVGVGVTVGVAAEVDGSAPTGAAAGRDDDAGAGPLDALVESAVTVTTPTACALVGGSVVASAEAVRLTHAAPLDGVAIAASRVNNAGVTSVSSDPSWHESVPSPLGQRPVNDTRPADAASVTDTSGAAPFNAWT